MINFVLCILLLILTPPSQANWKDFIEESLIKEQINDHLRDKRIHSDVTEEYKISNNLGFPLKAMYIPINQLHIVDSGLGSKEVRDKFFSQDQKFLYLIHPDSNALYLQSPLFKKKIESSQSIQAKATSSPRSLVLLDNSNTLGIVAKVSLDKNQFGLGRVVPDWEVRRSVSITKALSKTPDEEWQRHGVNIVPEIFGAYIDRSLGLHATVDAKQPLVLQHGMIIRDLTGLYKKSKTHDIYPLFSIFSEREGGQKPLGIEWFENSDYSDFNTYINDKFIEPFVLKTAYLTMYQGIIPEAHGQNVLVAINRTTKAIDFVYHRDIGSMKVDYITRMIRGLHNEDLVSDTPNYDFKYKRASESHLTPYIGWYLGYIWGENRGHAETIAKYIPSYSFNIAATMTYRAFEKALSLHFHIPGEPIPQDLTEEEVAKWIDVFHNKSKPKFQIIYFNNSRLDKKVKSAIEQVERYNQQLDLPFLWSSYISKKLGKHSWAMTTVGLIYRDHIRDGFLPTYSLIPNFNPDINDYVPPKNHYHIPKIKIMNVSTPQKIYSKYIATTSPTNELKVIKYGTVDSPYFLLLTGVDMVSEQISSLGISTISAEVIEDISSLSPSNQLKILKPYLNYWAPHSQPKIENIKDILPISETVEFLPSGAYLFLNKYFPLGPFSQNKHIEYAKKIHNFFINNPKYKDTYYAILNSNFPDQNKLESILKTLDWIADGAKDTKIPGISNCNSLLIGKAI